MVSSQIYLDKDALKNNIQFIRSRLNKGVILSSVLKGNAYGHGIAPMVNELEKLDVNHFSVFSSQEAKQVKLAAKNPCVIMIMGHVSDEDIAWIIENEIEVYVFDFDRIKLLKSEAKKRNTQAKIHIEIETGMNRTGFNENEWDELVNLVKKDDCIDLVGVCTHFAGAESIANYKRIREQQIVFDGFKEKIEKAGLRIPVYHTSCSAALMAYPEEQRNLVRIGILQYGFWPSREILVSYLTKDNIEKSPLQRVISWQSNVLSVKHIDKKEFVGYGMSFLAEVDMKMATVPVGYSSGYSRDLSNRGKVIIRGKRLDVIGIINMNLLMVDVTTLDEIEKGDEVILIGESKNIEISVASFSEATNRLNYELLTQLDKDIPRKFK